MVADAIAAGVRKLFRAVLATADDGELHLPARLSRVEEDERRIPSERAGAGGHEVMNPRPSARAGDWTGNRPGVSFLLPCYNEGAVLKETYRRVKEVAQQLEQHAEIVMVNDGSKD